MEESVKEVRIGVLLFKGLSIVSATPAPLVNQQIPLISHSGLEHFQSIHPRRLKDVLMASCTTSLLPEPLPSRIQ